MICFRPDARWEILRAARILRLRVDAFEAGPFRPDPPFVQRDVVLMLTLLAVHKGDVQEAPGERIHTQVTQTANATNRHTALPGVWSAIDLDPGLELVAFTGAEGATAAEALVDPVCFELLPALSAADDVASAEEAGCPELPLAELIGRLERRGASFGPLFAHYLVDRLPEVFPDHAADLDAVLRVLESRDLGPPARFALCSGIVGRFILVGRVPLDMLRRLLASLFRLLTMPEAADLHPNLASTWIPNLVGIEGSMEPVGASDVLTGGSRRAEIATAVQQLRGPEAVAPLMAWLAS